MFALQVRALVWDIVIASIVYACLPVCLTISDVGAVIVSGLLVLMAMVITMIMIRYISITFYYLHKIHYSAPNSYDPTNQCMYTWYYFFNVMYYHYMQIPWYIFINSYRIKEMTVLRKNQLRIFCFQARIYFTKYANKCVDLDNSLKINSSLWIAVMALIRNA